jgi:hypothetical protein
MTRRTIPCSVCDGIAWIETDRDNFPGKYDKYVGDGVCECEDVGKVVRSLLLSALEDVGYRVGTNGRVVVPKKVWDLVDLLSSRIAEMLSKVKRSKKVG